MAQQQRINYNRISIVLAERRLKNKDLADRIGLTEGRISKYTTNASQPSVITLFKIARALNCQVGDLLERVENVPEDLSEDED